MKIVKYEDLEKFLNNIQQYSDGKAEKTGKAIAWTAGKLRRMFDTIPVFEIDCEDIEDIKTCYNQYRISKTKIRYDSDKRKRKIYPDK